MTTITKKFLDNIAEATHPVISNPQRYLEQSKRISQIVAWIWLHLKESDVHYNTAKTLDRYFKNTKIGDTDYKLKDLLFAQKGSELFKLMQEIFKDNPSPLEEPIFSEEEREVYNIGVVVDRYRTELIDPYIGEQKYTAIMAYPPRPLISDYGQLSEGELWNWVHDNSSDTRPDKRTAPNPFIPLCCS